MHLSFERSWKSITEPLTWEELNDLVVLTGPNGAGKSQVLDAIEGGAIRVDGAPEPNQPQQVRIFRLSELMAQVEPEQALTSFRERWAQVAQHITNLAQQWAPGHAGNPAGLEEAIVTNLRQSNMASEGAIVDLKSSQDKYLQDYSLQEIKNSLPLLHAQVDPFRLSVSEVFGTYFLRRDDNTYQEYKASTGRDYAPYLSDSDFVARYGPPPWEVLNEALLSIGLNYAFDPPTEASETIPFSPRLRHREEGIDLSVGDLSAGERTLLAIALSLYTGTDRPSDYLQLPRVLLLDEPDASLHPSMVIGLLKVLREIFIESHGVKVVMTTHSPTTVALAPEEALYSMRRGSGARIEKISTDRAVAALAVGVPTLSVRVEDRRTVIVEERDDVACYEMLYRQVRGRMSTPHSLTFMASGSGSSTQPENSGSSSEVRRLVKELRDNGNDLVFGVIDRDQSNSESEFVKIAGDRYSIENHVLDPLLVGAFLLMHDHIDAAGLGLPEGLRHFELRASHAPAILNAIASRMQIDTSDRRPARYEGDFEAQVPAGFLETQGHQLEAQYKDKFPPLNAQRKLMVSVLNLAARDVPGYIPSSIREMYERIATP